jgi:hypothetical protein
VKTAFDIADLRRRGFVGFVPVAQLDDEPPQVPQPSGVYAVVRGATAAPRFLERSGAGWWKGKDPTVPVTRLAAEWVTGVQTLYLGDAKSLHERVGELVEFSRAHGESVRHWGGRLLWQLERCQALLVAWKVEPYSGALEYDLLEEFIEAYGRLPFANLKRGNRNAPRHPDEPPPPRPDPPRRAQEGRVPGSALVGARAPAPRAARMDERRYLAEAGGTARAAPVTARDEKEERDE